MEVGHDEADARVQLAGIPLHLRHHPAPPVPALWLMDEQPAPEGGGERALQKRGSPTPSVRAAAAARKVSTRCSPNHSVQDGLGGSAWDVWSHGARPSDFCAIAPTRPTQTPAQPRVAKVARTARCDPRLQPFVRLADGRPCVKVPPGSSPRLPRARLAQPGGRWSDRCAASAAARRPRPSPGREVRSLTPRCVVHGGAVIQPQEPPGASRLTNPPYPEDDGELASKIAIG
jgi:hypothetical protein